MTSSSDMEDHGIVYKIQDIGGRLSCVRSSHVQQLHLLDEFKEAAPEATDCENVSRSTTLTTDSNGKRDDASKAKKSSKRRKSITRSKQQKSSENIDSGTENEDEQPPIASMKESNSRSKISAKGESSKKTNKKQRTESEIIATATAEMKAGLDSTEVQPEKLKQRTEATTQTPGIKVCGLKLVGCKIKVWWPQDREFHPATIASFHQASNKYEVLYQDGDDEMLDLKKEIWELVKDGEEMISGSEAAPVDTVTSESETSALVEVRGYMVKASTADTLEGIFSKHGDIASNCPYKSASIKASLLEVVCTTLQKLQNEDSLPDCNEVESIINDADKAKLEIVWLRMELEKRVAHEADLNVKMLRGTQRRVLHAAKAAKSELKHGRAELAVAQKRIEEVERCFNALRCVQNKFKDDILELEESRKKRSKIV